MSALICAACVARAQDGAPASAPAPAAAPPAVSASDSAEQSLLDRKTQKIEHIEFEDSGNRVEELRVGGQTQSIIVHPKDGAPAYEVAPTNPNTHAPDAGIGQTGPRVWRVHQF
jgi:hypothetical protein